MDDVARDALPPPLDLLWGRRRRERERKRGLDTEAIVRAAVELADEGGLAAVSMSRVAERLGFTTMALYRHVRSKDELLAVMVDAAAEPPTALDDAGGAGWRPALERWSYELLAVVRRHPWLLDVPLVRMPFGPTRLAWLERGLRALADTALSEDEKAALVLQLNNYVFSEARMAAEIGDRGATPDTAASDDVLSALVDAEQFPALRRALDAGIFDPSGREPDADFAFGLERLLDGIEQLITNRRSAQK